MSPPRRALRISLIAASLASAPELAKYTTPPRELAARRSASLTIGALVNRFETCISRAACVRTAPTTSGWQWPSEQTAIPDRKSRYSTPSTSRSTQPEPSANSIG